MWETICRMKAIRICRDAPRPPILGEQDRGGSVFSPVLFRPPPNWGPGGLLLTLLFALPAAAAPDLPNFHAVAPGIWRGAAPTEAGLKRLKGMGVKTVIDLRIAPKTVRREGVYARSLGFHWINLPMGSDPPTPGQVSTFLSTLGRALGEPVFVHCQHGADRTGCMVGIYRVARQGWTFPRAYAEMRQDGFDPRWGRLREAVQVRAK